jgi:hypothetical protein
VVCGDTRPTRLPSNRIAGYPSCNPLQVARGARGPAYFALRCSCAPEWPLRAVLRSEMRRPPQAEGLDTPPVVSPGVELGIRWPPPIEPTSRLLFVVAGSVAAHVLPRLGHLGS